MRLVCANRQTARLLLCTGKLTSSKGDQTQREEGELSLCGQRTPEQESLASQIVINQDGHGVDLSFACHACSFARIASCPGLGGCAAI